VPGVRIQHPTERNANFTLVDNALPYHEPYTCGTCHRVHVFKTYHIKLDETGAGIVSKEVVERLQRIPGNPFRITNEVAKPPEQRLTLSRLTVQAASLGFGSGRKET
jgi:hypothetical protein